MEQIVGVATKGKVATAARNAIKQWLDIDEGPTPFAFAGLCKLFTFSDTERKWCSAARKMLLEQEVKLEQSF